MLHKFVFLLMGADFSGALKTDVKIFHCHFIVKSPGLLTFHYWSCWASPSCFLTLDFFCVCVLCLFWTSLGGGSDGKASAYNAGDRGSILGREDLLEKEMATHTTILTWKIPWTEEPGRLQSMGWQRVRTRLRDFTFTCLFFCWTILLKFVLNSLFIRYLSIYALSSEMSYWMSLSTLKKNETLSSFLLK